MASRLQGAHVSADRRVPVVDFSFPQEWQAEILPARPLILPRRHFTYPAVAEEVERGALEILVRPAVGEEFLATCALGFGDAVVPTGIWSCPNPDEICAVSGGYAYVVSTRDPARFAMIPFRPVLEVRAAIEARLLLFVGHHAIFAWGVSGMTWESPKLSDEGLTIATIDDDTVTGRGWNMITDQETPFLLDLRDGRVRSEHFD